MNQKTPLLAPYGSMQYLALSAKLSGKGGPRTASKAPPEKR